MIHPTGELPSHRTEKETLVACRGHRHRCIRVGHTFATYGTLHVLLQVVRSSNGAGMAVEETMMHSNVSRRKRMSLSDMVIVRNSG